MKKGSKVVCKYFHVICEKEEYELHVREWSGYKNFLCSLLSEGIK